MLASKLVLSISLHRRIQLYSIKNQKIVLRKTLLEKVKLNYLNKYLNNLMELNQIHKLTIEINEIEERLKLS